MATRGTISVMQENGEVKSIYSHYDNYIDGGTGESLLFNFNTLERANEVISEGSIRFVSIDGDFESYHWWRGEKVVIDTFKDEKDYTLNCDYQEYNYLFKNGKWYINNRELSEYFVEGIG